MSKFMFRRNAILQVLMLGIFVSLCVSEARASGPTISTLSPTSGLVGASVTVSGANFGSSQGTSTVTFNGTTASVSAWSDSSINVSVPSGATTGNVIVTVGGLLSNGIYFTVLETTSITNLSPVSGAVGESVTIMGTGFGATQGVSAVSLNGIGVTITSWSDISIVAIVPSGTSSGPFSVTVNGQTVYSASFTVTTLPSGWSDSDVGSVGVAGSASFSNGMFTVKGSGSYVYYTADQMNFLYQILSGDGTIVARVVSATGSTSPQGGIMIRETLNAGSTNAYVHIQGTNALFWDRPTTGGSTVSQSSTAGAFPYWVKLTRSGNTFSAYSSYNGITWTQLGTSQTISMAQNVYVGLVTCSQANSTLATGTFDNVSVNSAVPAPAITAVSATTGSIGSQVTITGTGFGNSENGSLVTLNDVPVSINSWTNTSITITIPSGATSGYLVVSVAPNMNDSNAVFFTVTSQPLPAPWLDQDMGQVGIAGSATFASETFTITGSGSGIYAPPDEAHYAYQALSGNGSIVARVVSASGSTAAQAAVMIRATLDPSSIFADVYWDAGSAVFMVRTNTGVSGTTVGTLQMALPCWVKLVQSGSSFSGYASHDGMNWAQIGTTQTITMPQNTYIGLSGSSESNSALATLTIDNVSVNTAAVPAPVITSLSGTTGSIGSSVVIKGTGFGNVQNGSLVLLNGAPVSINLWSDTTIEFTIPTGATSGNLVVYVAPNMNSSNPVYFEVTSQPLPPLCLNQDVGANGVIGSSTYNSSTGVYTVTGAGTGTFSGSTDGVQFSYQTLSGDGTVVARIISLQGGAASQAGIMIRETLSTSATNAFVFYYSGNAWMTERTTTGGNSAYQSGGTAPLPYWLKLVRSGNSFSGYQSPDGVTWTQVGTTQTISMASTVYAGIAVTSRSVTATSTATFDGLSVSTSANPAPQITSVSATTGSVGSQVVITGSNFGANQGASQVFLNDVAVSSDTWSNTSIIFIVPTGATSGPLLVSLAPTMNDSNAVQFTVTSQPLPVPWLDADIGTVGVAGSATYANGVFTVTGGGAGALGGTADGLHFAYQQMTGDGSIVARVASLQGNSSPQAGVMIRDTLNAGAANAFTCLVSNTAVWMSARPSTGASSTYGGGVSVTPPIWVKLVRVGSTFTGYKSSDGVTWIQVWTTQTLTIGQTVDVGLGVSSHTTSASATGTFDNVSITIGTTPFVTSVSPALVGVGSSVTITGSNFGATQGTSSVQFNGVATTSTTSWSGSQIIALVPTTVLPGSNPVSVTVGGITSPVNPTLTVIMPIITSVAPPAAQPGGQVTITGSGFGPAGVAQYEGQVMFNGVAGIKTSWTDTQVTALVPTPTATSGPLTVTYYGFPSNSVPFTVLEALTITNVSPAIGPAGTTVTITGTGFGPTQSTSTVDFYGTSATVQSWNDTQIVATAPAGTASGSVNVTVASKTLYGPNYTITQTNQLTDSKGNQSSYTSAMIGGLWVPTSVQGSGCSTCTARGNISYAYDSAGHPLSRTDENGNTPTYTYDSNGNVLTVTAPVNVLTSGTTTYTYNSFGEVLTMTDPMNFVTTNTYDANGNLLSVTKPAPGNGASASVTRFAYDSKGELTRITDPLGNQTNIAYFPTGMIQTVTDAQSNVTTYAYDSQGNRTSVTDANSKQTTFTYDAMNRLTKITYPDTTTTQFGYDIRGRRTSVTDQNSKQTTYAYDDADRLTSVTDAANNVTTYGYDTENNLTSIKDANNNTTTFDYDAFGRVTATHFPSGQVEQYAYDNVGNLSSKTDRKNQQITYTYDQLNRLTVKSYPDTTTVNYTYDNDSRLTQVTDPTGTYQFTFDNMGRLTGTTTGYAFLAGRNFTTSYGYDAASNRTSFTDPDSGSTGYVYDTLNRLQTLTPPAAISGGSFGFGYDALSRRTSLTRPNSVNTSYSYDNLSRLLSVTHAKGGVTLDGATYTVDNAGNRNSKADLYAGVTTNYGYDNIYELLSATQGASTTESYTYDPVGNRLSNLSGSGWSNNTSNELTSRPGVTYTYDNNGNTLTKTDSTGTTIYTWDFENRLTSVTLPGSGGTVSFKYDPLGRRIYKSSSNGTSIFAYDGDNLVEETNGAGAAVARYSQGLNIDEPLAMLRSSTTSYYQADGLGSVTSLTNAAGTAAQNYTYDSFGNIIATSGSIVNNFRFTGREWDAESSLYYYRARYYDSQTGRFNSEDPTQFTAGPNFYSYVANDPIYRIDPFGLDWIRALSDGAAGAGSALSFGLTDVINDATGASSVVNKCSSAHKFGTGVGIALGIAIGGALGAEAAEANAGRKGYEFSHFIPDRMGGPRSVFNGNYVSEQLHYLTDPFRFPQPAGAALRWGPKLNPVLGLALRVPLVYGGAAAGGALVGIPAAARSNCGCS